MLLTTPTMAQALLGGRGGSELPHLQANRKTWKEPHA
jgi:hypothetical protein